MTSPYQQLLEHARRAQAATDAQRASAAETAAKVAAARSQPASQPASGQGGQAAAPGGQ